MVKRIKLINTNEKIGIMQNEYAECIISKREFYQILRFAERSLAKYQRIKEDIRINYLKLIDSIILRLKLE